MTRVYASRAHAPEIPLILGDRRYGWHPTPVMCGRFGLKTSFSILARLLRAGPVEGHE
jgi:hypothetical protein